MLLPPGGLDSSSVGTLLYMAPESVRSMADHRADLFSAAVVLYEMLTGTMPFPARTAAALKTRILEEQPSPPMAVNPALSREVNAVVMRGLEKDPERRRLEADDLRRFL
jgi:serine/threonine-protein kinase